MDNWKFDLFYNWDLANHLGLRLQAYQFQYINLSKLDPKYSMLVIDNYMGDTILHDIVKRAEVIARYDTHDPKTPKRMKNAQLLFEHVLERLQLYYKSLPTYNESEEKHLLKHVVNKYNQTPLDYANRSINFFQTQEQYNVFKPFYDFIHQRTEDPKFQIMKSAIQAKNMEAIEKLLSEGFDIHMKNAAGNPIFVYVMRYGSIPIIDLFIAKGIDIREKINGYSYCGYTQNNELRSYLWSLIYKEKARWTGFTNAEADKFNLGMFFDTTGKTANKLSKNGLDLSGNDIACCPICLKYTYRTDGCMYMNHDCKEAGDFYHEDLYNQYKTNEGKIWWCTICGRVAQGHRHYKLASVLEAPGLEAAGEPFENDCSITSHGGGLPEKIARFHDLLKKAEEANSNIGKISAEEALLQLVEASWNGPLHTTPENIKKIIADKKWNNINQSKFVKNTNSSSNNSSNNNNGNAPNVVRPNKNNPSRQPKIEKGTNTLFDEENVDVIQFRHVDEEGVLHNHPTDRISIENFLNWLKSKVENHGLPEFGFCYMYPDCKARLYPDEIDSLEPHIPPERLDEFKELLTKYKKYFNKKFQPKKGGGRTPPIIKELTDGVCPLPPKKKGGRRKTYKLKKGKRTRKHK